MERSWPIVWWGLLVGPIVAVGLMVGIQRPAHAQPVGDPFLTATTELGSASSYKVRAQAALVLGRRGEARATPYLIRALHDPSAPVRAVAAQALGEVGDATAQKPLATAAADHEPFVRRAATAALRALAARAAQSQQAATVRPPGQRRIHVKSMGDRTRKASPRLRDDMRRFVADEVNQFEGRSGRELSIDGAIKVLDLSAGGSQVAVTCGVELILSAGTGGGIIVMSTGEATVQRQHRTFRPGMQAGMEQEALAQAVRGAADELRQHLAANGP